MSQPPLDSTPIGTNTNNRKMSPIDLIPVGKTFPEPTPMTPSTDLPTLPKDFPEGNGKVHVTWDPDPYPSLSDSTSKKSNFTNDSNSSQ